MESSSSIKLRAHDPLDMEVIAEFVESDTMFDKLREANVDYIQGYTVGKPVSIETLLTFDEPGQKKFG